jgi:hypothetical protein
VGFEIFQNISGDVECYTYVLVCAKVEEKILTSYFWSALMLQKQAVEVIKEL